MKLEHKKQVSDTEYLRIKELADLCCHHDHILPACPDREDEFILLYAEDSLQAFLSMDFTEEHICECRAYTRPKVRRLGYFSQCLEEACRILEEYEDAADCQVELCLLCSQDSQHGIAALEALEADLWFSEYLMELEIPEKTELSAADITLNHCLEDNYEIRQGQKTVGSFCLCQADTYAFLYQLNIQENHRRKGYAFKALQNIIQLLSSHHVPCLRLQVSGLNEAACSLYKKTGFHITETLSYYLY